VLVCPTEADPRLTVWRRDDAGHVSLWSGRYDDLQAVPLGIEISEVGQRGGDTFIALAGTPAQPDALGLYLIDYRSFAVTELVPAATGTPAWSSGATSVGPLDSATLDLPSNLLYQMQSIGDQFRLQPGDGRRRHHHLRRTVRRRDADEIAIFRVGAPEEIERVGLRPAGKNSPARPASPPAPAATRAGVTTSCWSGRRRGGGWSPVGGRGRISSRAPVTPEAAISCSWCSRARSGSRPGRWCWCRPSGRARATARQRARIWRQGSSPRPDFSPDGASLFWLIQDDDIDAELWLAASDGSAERLVASDVIAAGLDAPHFTGDSQLELKLDQDLVWIDVRDESARPTPSRSTCSAR
jgi:hypothetical protein